MPFPPTGERFQLSPAGGVQPRWRGDGRELYYLDLSGQIMSVAVPGGDPRRAGKPQALFKTALLASSINDQYTAAADGQRFLIRRPTMASGFDLAAIHVLVNWPQILGTPGEGR